MAGTFINGTGVVFPDSTTQTTAGLSSTTDVQTFTSSGIWYKPTTGSFRQVQIVCVGAGGSGGRAAAGNAGSGGGGGATCIRTMRFSSLPSSVSVTVAGTTAAPSTNTNGNVGSPTSFGSYLTAYGGGGGAGSTSTTASFGGGGGGGGGGAGGTGASGGVPGAGGVAAAISGFWYATVTSGNNPPTSFQIADTPYLAAGGSYNNFYGCAQFPSGINHVYLVGPNSDFNFASSGGGAGGYSSAGTATTSNAGGGGGMFGAGGGGGGADNTGSAPGGAGGVWGFGATGGAGGINGGAPGNGGYPGGGGGGAENQTSGTGGGGWCEVTCF